MDLVKQHGPQHIEAVDQQAETKLSTLDHLTKVTAVAISRRTFGKRVFAATAAILGINLLDVQRASAAACNYCYSDCRSCTHGITNCCSPNGVYCADFSCNCGPCNCCRGAWCCSFRAVLQVCDDGYIGRDCPWCC